MRIFSILEARNTNEPILTKSLYGWLETRISSQKDGIKPKQLICFAHVSAECPHKGCKKGGGGSADAEQTSWA